MNTNGNDLSDTWSPGIEYILEEIRLNSITISEHHKEKYYYSKGYLKYFRIPTILFSAMNSVFSVGLQPYCPQPIISLICCIISLVCGVISSVELFLSIQSTMENELIASKDFYLLSVDIFKILSLERATRMINGKTYLDETYQTYCKLIENSNIVNAEMKNMIEPNRHFSLYPKLISTAKEEVGVVELSSIIINKSIMQEEVDDKKEEEEEEEDKKEDEVKPEDINATIEKENIIIQELEENNRQVVQVVQLVIEEEKETTEEEGSNETHPKPKRKYVKKKN
jgi:hypothetical protein